MLRPWVGRKFGVEMEMNQCTTQRSTITHAALKGAVRSALVGGGFQPRIGTVSGYGHSDGSTWDIKTDSSAGATDGESGWEVASPAMMMDDSGNCPELKAVCFGIAGLQPQVNRKCGLHVHIEVRDYDWRDLQKLITLWSRYEPFFFELTPDSRRSNRYCPPFRKSRWADPVGPYWQRIEQVIEATSERQFTSVAQVGCPRGSLNVAHWFRSKRVEFRLAAGTVSYEKIAKWTQLLLALVARVKKVDMPPVCTGQYSDRGFSTMYIFKMLGLAETKWVPATMVAPESVELMEWVEARRQQFKVRASAPAGRSVQPAQPTW